MTRRSKREIASSAAVVLFLVSCLAHGQHTNAKQDEINTSEYEIFSAFIEQAFVGKAGAERVALPVSRVIIVDTTDYDVSEIQEEMSWKKLLDS